MKGKDIVSLGFFSFRISTCLWIVLSWYRDNVTGQPVRIMLTEAGERKVRTRFGLSCEKPDDVPVPMPVTSNSNRQIRMQLSPATRNTLQGSLSAASSSGSGELVLDAVTITKLGKAMRSNGILQSDSLGPES